MVTGMMDGLAAKFKKIQSEVGGCSGGQLLLNVVVSIYSYRATAGMVGCICVSMSLTGRQKYVDT